MITTTDKCEIVTDKQIKQALLNYLLNNNIKDLQEFIADWHYKSELTIELAKGKFVFQLVDNTFTEKRFKLAMPNVIQGQQPTKKQLKSVFKKYVDNVGVYDLVMIHKNLVDYPTKLNQDLCRQLRHWIFSNISRCEFDWEKLKIGNHLKELSCYLLEMDDDAWAKLINVSIIALLRYYNEHFEDSLPTALVIERLETSIQPYLIALNLAKLYFDIYSKTKYRIKHLEVPFPNSQVKYTLDDIEEISRKKPVLLTLTGEYSEDNCFRILCEDETRGELEKMCETGNCHFKKDDFANLINALPKIKALPLDLIMIKEICRSLELIKQYSE